MGSPSPLTLSGVVAPLRGTDTQTAPLVSVATLVRVLRRELVAVSAMRHGWFRWPNEAHLDPAAFPASSVIGFWRAVVRVLRRELVAVFAVRPLSPHPARPMLTVPQQPTRRRSSSHVLRVTDRLQVCRIHARRVAAQVVKFKPVANRAERRLVGVPMGLRSSSDPLAASFWPRPHIDAVAGAICGELPYPTTIGVDVELGREPIFQHGSQCTVSASHDATQAGKAFA